MPRKKPPVKVWPTLDDLPPLCTLPQVAALFHRSPHWCHDHLDRDAAVLRLPDGRVLDVHRQGRGWVAWRADLADLVREEVA
jgi:hypothetical protein